MHDDTYKIDVHWMNTYYESSLLLLPRNDDRS